MVLYIGDITKTNPSPLSDIYIRAIREKNIKLPIISPPSTTKIIGKITL